MAENKKKGAPNRATAAAAAEKKIAAKTKPGLTDDELDKVVGGQSIKGHEG